MLQPGVAEEVEVRRAARRRDAGEETAVGRGRGRRVLLRPAPERVVPVHRPFRSGGTDNADGRDGRGVRGRQADSGVPRAPRPDPGSRFPTGQLGPGHANGRGLYRHDGLVVAVRRGRRQRAAYTSRRQGRSDHVRVMCCKGIGSFFFFFSCRLLPAFNKPRQ